MDVIALVVGYGAMAVLGLGLLLISPKIFRGLLCVFVVSVMSPSILLSPKEIWGAFIVGGFWKS